jgi:hypothetical protein
VEHDDRKEDVDEGDEQCRRNWQGLNLEIKQAVVSAVKKKIKVGLLSQEERKLMVVTG